VDQIRYYTEAEKVKLAVKPGITGLAQISGRNAIAWEARKVWDAEYVKRQSFLLDLVILCKTIPYILKREGVNSPAATNQEV
jgi:lipopolysaccharide/colanic/teichoic acid biosynthesis glycosyltransferase